MKAAKHFLDFQGASHPEAQPQVTDPLSPATSLDQDEHLTQSAEQEDQLNCALCGNWLKIPAEPIRFLSQESRKKKQLLVWVVDPEAQRPSRLAIQEIIVEL